MAEKDTSTQYKTLGRKLQQLREQHRESVAEVSGAVEIPETQLAAIESGKNRPSEDILTLLINHFALEDSHADELWKLAGYDLHDGSDHEHGLHNDERDDIRKAATSMMIMLDPRVMYSDSVEVVSNKQGVIVNFSQTTGSDSPPLTVARVGMSYEQAKAVMGIMYKILYDHDNPRHSKRLSGGTKKGKS